MTKRLSSGAIRRGVIRTRRAELSLSSGAMVSFKRDALGRVVEREERVLSGEAVTSRYEYDERGRLVSVTTNGVMSESYAYDANGNRLGGEYDAQDRKLSYGGATYAYDLNGSMTNRNGGFDGDSPSRCAVSDKLPLRGFDGDSPSRCAVSDKLPLQNCKGIVS